MDTKIFMGLNHLFPIRWRWAIKRFLRLKSTQPYGQLGDIDFISGSKVIYDVGARLGSFLLEIILRAPLSIVHCFEPNPDVFPDLLETCNRLGKIKNSHRAIANPLGVGSSSGSLELIVAKFNPASSFLPVSQACMDGWNNLDFSEERRISVPVITLDKYSIDHQVNDIKLLKIDVQGFELEVLKGCGEFLSKIEYIFLEIQFVPLYIGAPTWEVILSFLYNNEFRPINMAGFCLDKEGRPLQADMLFRNQKYLT